MSVGYSNAYMTRMKRKRENIGVIPNLVNEGYLVGFWYSNEIRLYSYFYLDIKNTNIEVLVISSGDGETLQKFVEDQNKVHLDQRELVRINFQLDLEDSEPTQEVNRFI